MNRCTGCLKAPTYDESVSKSTFYCSHVCQKADWSQHKSNCKMQQARKTLGRAARLLQAIIYRIRLHASPLRFKSVRVEGSVISLHGFEFFDGSERLLKPFPVCLDCDRSLAEAVLVYMGCMEAMMYLHGFAEKLLAGKLTFCPCSLLDWILTDCFDRALFQDRRSQRQRDRPEAPDLRYPSKWTPHRSTRLPLPQSLQGHTKEWRDVGSGHNRSAIRISGSSMSLA